MISPRPKVWVSLAFASCLCSSAFAVDLQPPAVAITQPTPGATLTGRTTVTVTASDSSGVTNVVIKIDGAPTSSTRTPPYQFMVDTGQLGNGLHTLHAVVTDGAGNVATSAIISVNITNPPRYELGQLPFMIENLGGVLSVNSLDRPAYFQLSNHTHLLLFYLTDYGTSPFQILDVDLSQGTAQLTDGVLGRLGARASVLYSNGKIYLGTAEANGTGYFMEYNPTTGATRQIAQISDIGNQFSEVGDDGWIYLGETSHGSVDRYNPDTDTFQRLGQMDTNYAGNGQYAYTLGADSRYLYVGLGQSPWYLSIYDTQLKTKTLYWATNGDTLGAVRQSTNGSRFYYRRDAANVVTWYRLTNGIPVLTTYNVNIPPPGLLVENAQRGNMVDGVVNGYLLGYEVNLDDAYPNSSANFATIRWRAVGATNWQSVGIGGFHLAAVGVSRLYPWDSTHLMVFSSFYGPVCLWDINNHQTSVLGYPQFNLYDAVFGQGVAYFSGYTAATLRYDPSRTWTFTGSTVNRFDTTINPYQTSLVMGKHEFYSTFGADGLVYVGARHERDSSGGELGWYDPAKGTSGSLRSPFLDFDIADLKPALGGTKLVYSSTSTNLFVFDVATKAIVRTIVPLPGIVMDKVVEVAPGIMFGVTGSNVFKVNITNGSVISSSMLPGKAFAESIKEYNRRLVLGPDGYIWMFRWYRDAQNFNKSSLYRINPADYSYSVILTNTFYTYGENNVMFNGGDLYMYGGTTLYRIPGILNFLALLPPTALRVSGPTGN